MALFKVAVLPVLSYSARVCCAKVAQLWPLPARHCCANCEFGWALALTAASVVAAVVAVAAAAAELAGGFSSISSSATAGVRDGIGKGPIAVLPISSGWA